VFEGELSYWREATGDVGDPSTYGRTDLERLLHKLLDHIPFEGIGKGSRDQKIALEEIWGAAGGDCACVAIAFDKAIKAHQCKRTYVKALLIKGFAHRPPPAPPRPPVVKSPPPPEPEPDPESEPAPESEPDPESEPAANEKKERPKKAKKTSDKTPPQPDQETPIYPHVSIPSMLIERHQQELLKRGISADYALANGVKTIADNEARRLGFEASIGISQRSQGLQGIGFEYFRLNGHKPIWRLKPDSQFLDHEGKHIKYISRIGEMAAFYAQKITPEIQADSKIQVVITEGEFKALAIAEQICKIASRPTVAIGLVGVNGGWESDKIYVPKPDGTKEVKKEGHPHLIDDLEEWDWKKRVVYICFDSDVGTKKHAAEFKLAKRRGAIGAEYQLALLLRAKGADVRIVILPPKVDGSKYGADDYIAEQGKFRFLTLLYNNWVVDRNIDEILYTEKAAALRFEKSTDFVAANTARPSFVIDKIVPVPGLAMLAGGSGVGKSAIALNAAYAVASGGKFLGRFDTQQGKALYIQTELSRALVEDRVRSLGTHENMEIMMAGYSMPLNHWEPDGYNKRRETGNREIFIALMDRIKAGGFRLVIFDPFSDFHTFAPTEAEGAQHMMLLFRQLANVCNAGVLVIHHHRKTGGQKEQYEGMDDFYGPMFLGAKVDTGMSIYSYTRKDETIRYKLKFSKQRVSEQLPAMEINRIAQENFYLWEADDWVDSDAATLKQCRDLRDLIAVAGGTAKDLIARSKLAKRTFFRAIKELIEAGAVEKKGTFYYLSREETDKQNG
jgi:archaellum biogenesis ATPase FlaH